MKFLIYITKRHGYIPLKRDMYRPDFIVQVYNTIGTYPYNIPLEKLEENRIYFRGSGMDEPK